MSKPVARVFQIHAHTRLPKGAAVAVTREALSAAHASVTDIRHLSNKASVFQLCIPSEQWDQLLEAVSAAALTIDDYTPKAAEDVAKDRDGDINGTLQLLYLGEESESKDEIPAVPG